MPRISAKLAKANRLTEEAPGPYTKPTGRGPPTGGRAATAAQHGRECMTQVLFAAPTDTWSTETTWVETEPYLEPAAADHDHAAIKLFRRRAKGAQKYELQTIRIQSPIMRRLLRPILADYGQLVPESDDLEFEAPFQSLFHNLDAIEDAMAAILDVELDEDDSDDEDFGKDEKDQDRAHVGHLQGLLSGLFWGTKERRRQLLADSLIDFDMAWTLFPRGEIVTARRHGHDCLFRLVSIELKTGPNERYWAIRAESNVFDGVRFGAVHVDLAVPAFSGFRAIETLAVCPARHHPRTVDRQAFVKRGLMALFYQGAVHEQYKGMAYHAHSMEERQLDERVVVDTFAYAREVSGAAIKTRPVDLHTNRPAIKAASDNSEEPSPSRPTKGDAKKTTTALLDNNEFLMLLSPLVYGFGLQTKEWYRLSVNRLHKIAYNEAAFAQLVYPQARKDMIRTFIANFDRLRERGSDVVPGKGQGLIFNFSGPPGTGKTLTAEAIAEATHRPLYRLGAQDLGTNPRELASNLSRALRLAAEWRGILLIDEADVFTTQRHVNNVARNELVSIFLRELEYAKAIIILTTNHAHTMDDALRSRVHVHCTYPPLDAAARRDVWRKQFARGGALDAIPTVGNNGNDGDDAKNNEAEGQNEKLQVLAKYPLNGREISNAFGLAQGWCALEDVPLSLERLLTAVGVTAPAAVEACDALDRLQPRAPAAAEVPVEGYCA